MLKNDVKRKIMIMSTNQKTSANKLSIINHDTFKRYFCTPILLWEDSYCRDLFERNQNRTDQRCDGDINIWNT